MSYNSRFTCGRAACIGDVRGLSFGLSNCSLKPFKPLLLISSDHSVTSIPPIAPGRWPASSVSHHESDPDRHEDGCMRIVFNPLFQEVVARNGGVLGGL